MDVTIPQAARIARLGISTIRKMIYDGRLPAQLVRGRYLIPSDAIARLDLEPSTVDETVARIVDQAPELSDDQITALRVILRAGR